MKKSKFVMPDVSAVKPEKISETLGIMQNERERCMAKGSFPGAYNGAAFGLSAIGASALGAGLMATGTAATVAAAPLVLAAGVAIGVVAIGLRLLGAVRQSEGRIKANEIGQKMDKLKARSPQTAKL